MDFKTRIVTQIIMTCMMALTMSGIMATVILGVGNVSLSMWLNQFIIAWPIAFVMTNILFPIAMMLCGLVLGRNRN
ncbi:DUF2798 domain-containing protein [Aquamicrobium zhengzhouense]|uniref:DUF2798 domain-containing protein n=1 Tax=Aquamicrobium zhengzhouense TaxID=2781738 RepID=A0ABS0SC76_9HYPH|nr:DUF2798 domain-containing protein [Aquamicrobium zhengzhouense]MBI1620872.1 DUF2798 domain-containing protein [Aquamicrobium zhengzhouense]